MKKTSIIKLIVVAPILLTLNSCLEVADTITLKKDGSGTITEEILLGTQASAMIEQMSALGGQGAEAPDMFGEEAAKKRATALGTGVTVGKVEKLNDDGRKGSRVVYNFTDINTVTINISDAASGLSDIAPNAGRIAEKAKSDGIKFIYKDSTLTIDSPDKQKIANAQKDAKAQLEAAEAPQGPEAAQMQAMMLPMLKEMRMSLKLIVEPGIAESDATHQADSTITLMEMDMSKLLADPANMDLLKGINPTDQKSLEAKLKTLPGVKMEAKDPVTIKVK